MTMRCGEDGRAFLVNGKHPILFTLAVGYLGDLDLGDGTRSEANMCEESWRVS